MKGRMAPSGKPQKRMRYLPALSMRVSLASVHCYGPENDGAIPEKNLIGPIRPPTRTLTSAQAGSAK